MICKTHKPTYTYTFLTKNTAFKKKIQVIWKFMAGSHKNWEVVQIRNGWKIILQLILLI